MSRERDDYLSALLTEGPPASRCELVRHLRSDDFGPRVLACLRADDQALIVRGIAIADAAWVKASSRLQALAGVRSEHALPLVAYGRHEGLAYFIHEHEGGPRLNTLLRERDGRLDLRELLPIFGQVVLTVSDAHRRRIVLGGVRPQDVRVIPKDDGFRVLVRNLGLAGVLGVPAGRVGSTDHPSLYRAPELDVAKHPASDVFSLGVLFIRLLTGPLAGTHGETERQDMLRTRLQQAQREDGSLPHDLVELIRRTIDPEVEGRPRNATRLLMALLEILPLEALGLDAMPDFSVEPQAAPVVRDVPRQWPDRQWTALQQWERPMRKFAPREVDLSPSERITVHVTPPGPVEHSRSERITVHVTPPVDIPDAPPPQWPSKPRARKATVRSRSVLRRIAMGVGLLSTVTAVALTFAMGEPEASPAPESTTPSRVAVTAEASAVEAPVEPETSVGTVVIETNPPGVLTIDGKRIGTTPTQATIPSGRHVVRVEADGHRTWRSRIDLLAGQEHRVVVALQPEGGDHEPVRIGLLAPM